MKKNKPKNKGMGEGEGVVVRKTETGCTFHKGLKCSEKTNRKLASEGASKVFRNNEQKKSESNITRVLKKIQEKQKNSEEDEEFEFVNVVLGKCFIDKSLETTVRTKCNQFEFPKKLPKQLVYKHTGRLLSDVNTYSKNKKTMVLDKPRMNRILESFNNLIMGLKLLKKKNISIHNISSQNIICKDDDKILFDEFSLTRNYKKIYNFKMNEKIRKKTKSNDQIENVFKNASLYSRDSKSTDINFAPELKMYYYIVKYIHKRTSQREYEYYNYRNQRNDDSYDSIVKNIRNELLEKTSRVDGKDWNISKLQTLYNQTELDEIKDEDLENSLITMILSLLAKVQTQKEKTEETEETEETVTSKIENITGWMNTVLTEHADKIDVYAIGIVILEFYVACLKKNLEIDKRNDLLRIIRNSTTPNVFDRWNTEQLCEAYHNYINPEENNEDIGDQFELMLRLEEKQGGSIPKKKMQSLKTFSETYNEGLMDSKTCMTYTKTVLLAFLKKRKIKANMSMKKVNLCKLIKTTEKKQLH
jgi:hypothetical protein